LELSSKDLLTGNVSVQKELKKGEFAIGWARLEDAQDELNANLFVDKRPAVWLSRDFGHPGRDTSCGVLLSWMRLRETPTGVAATRRLADLSLRSAPLKLAGQWTATLGAGARWQAYDTGGSYRVRWGQVELSQRFGQCGLFGISYLRHRVGGQTPFLFDDVNIASELRTTLRLPVSERFTVGLTDRYDLTRDNFRDFLYYISVMDDVLEYAVEWGRGRRELGFRVYVH